MKKSLTVKLDDRTIEVGKLPLGKYSELLKAVQVLPEHIVGMDKLTNDEILRKLPAIIGASLPDIINMLTIATTLKKEEIEELGLDEVVRVVMAVIEVNNYKEIFDSLKKVTARREPAQAK